MGGAPVVETIRPGVQFTPAAAASFRRLEARLGREVDANSTYRDYDTQMGMYLAWTAYVEGRGPKPNHSRAIHPDYSIHCRGNALDSDDWRTPGFIALAAEYGWIRTAAGDPTEQHHFEYQWWEDRHYGEPTPAGLDNQEEDMALPIVITVSHPDPNNEKSQVYWSVDLAARTKAKIRNGIELDWRRALGIPEYVNQSPAVLDGYHNITPA